MSYPTPRVHTNQLALHKDLKKTLTRHRHSVYLKPIAERSKLAFEAAKRIITEQRKPLILDSGCGVGESTVHLARQFPQHFVLGIDKSAARLRKNHAYQNESINNYALLQTDLIDFWRLAAQNKWRIERHYLFYPNPWPKKKDLKKRYHGHPAFFDLIELGKYFELRSNWKLYLEEFAEAFFFATTKRFHIEEFVPQPCLTPFERKYLASEHELFRLILT